MDSRNEKHPICESFNSKIKGYLKLDHNLLQFFNHFCTVLGKKRQKELVAEYEARQKLPRLCLKRSPVLNQAASGCTPTIFDEFQNEFEESSALVLRVMKLSEEVVEILAGNYQGGVRVCGDLLSIILVHCVQR